MLNPSPSGKHSGAQNAIDLIGAIFVADTDRAKPVHCDNGAIEAPLAPPLPLPSPAPQLPQSPHIQRPYPPPPPLVHPFQQHTQYFIHRWISQTVHGKNLRSTIHTE